MSDSNIQSSNIQSSNIQESNAGAAEESIVDGVRRELEDIDASDLSEHTARFEALHKKLQDSLNSIDGL